MFSLKKLDSYTKSIDGVHQKTILGALLTICTFLFVIFLLFIEISSFLKPIENNHMLLDLSKTDEKIAVEFSLDFPRFECERLEFKQEITKASVHSQDPDHINKIKFGENGCRVSGVTVTDKVGGNFLFNYSKKDDEMFSISHKINYVNFHPIVSPISSSQGNKEEKRKENVLSNHESNSADGNGIHQYVLQIVPTTTKKLNKRDDFSYQYSVTERHIDQDQYEFVPSVGGHNARDFLGIIFTYDFSPVIIVSEEKRENIWDFLANLFGIIGGVITTLGIIERLLQISAKTVMGKKD